MADTLLDIRGLTIGIPGAGGTRPAVSNFDLSIARGEVVGLVGESGSGKSLSMQAVLGLLPRDFVVSGSIRFNGEEICGASERRLRSIRGARVAMVFQDPMTALNPVQTIGTQIVEMIRLHDRSLSRAALRERAVGLLSDVAIPVPEKRFDQYPHELSGGMRQRVVIATAIANDPELLIADEPTTALDVTIQAQIMEIFARLRETRNMAMVLITHDLGLVAGIADKVTVLYAGKVAERGDVHPIFAHPGHPYTASLLAAVPSVEGALTRLKAIPGSPPSLRTPLPPCPFEPRCDRAIPVCREREPVRQTFGTQVVSCHRAHEWLQSPEPATTEC